MGRMHGAVMKLLHIFATLPVTTATSERSFSALKYINTVIARMMIRPLDDHTIVLHLLSLIWGFSESCRIVHCITLQPVNLS